MAKSTKKSVAKSTKKAPVVAAPSSGLWLVKTEPEVYPWSQMLKDEETLWDHVRSFQARNNLKSMKKGDRLLWYHSGDEKALQGIVEVTREHYPDPTATPEEGDGWVVVDVKPVLALKRPVTLAQIKAEPSLAHIALVRQSRLSVAPLDQASFDRLVALGGGTTPV